MFAITNKLRWLVRDGEKVLQQKWVEVIMPTGRFREVNLDPAVEWRDVPTEEVKDD